MTPKICDAHQSFVSQVEQWRRETREDLGDIREEIGDLYTSVACVRAETSAINAKLDLVIDGKVRRQNTSKTPLDRSEAVSDTVKLLIKVVLFSAAISSAVVGIAMLIMR